MAGALAALLTLTACGGDSSAADATHGSRRRAGALRCARLHRVPGLHGRERRRAPRPWARRPSGHAQRDAQRDAERMLPVTRWPAGWAGFPRASTRRPSTPLRQPAPTSPRAFGAGRSRWAGGSRTRRDRHGSVPVLPVRQRRDRRRGPGPDARPGPERPGRDRSRWTPAPPCCPVPTPGRRPSSAPSRRGSAGGPSSRMLRTRSARSFGVSRPSWSRARRASTTGARPCRPARRRSMTTCRRRGHRRVPGTRVPGSRR